MSLNGEYKEIAIDCIEENEWNPNQMNDKQFDRLVREITETGMIAPIQVVPLDCGSRFRIIGGAHRYNVCKLLNYTHVPCVVLTDQSWENEDKQKLETVRLNIIKGDLNREKMLELYQDVSSRMSSEDMGDLWGFTNDNEWAKIVKETKKSLEDAGVDLKALQEFDDEVEKLDGKSNLMDRLGDIVTMLHEKYGDTIPKNYMFLEWGGVKHVQVQLRKPTFKKLEKMISYLDKKDIDIDNYLHWFFENHISFVNLEEIEYDKYDPSKVVFDDQKTF